MGRKAFELDWSKLEGMVMFDASLPVCALEQGTSPDTVERCIRKKYDKTFGEYKALYISRTILRLKQKMIKKALDGDNTCLIFTLKNISDWSDKVESQSKEEKQNILINIVKDNGGN